MAAAVDPEAARAGTGSAATGSSAACRHASTSSDARCAASGRSARRGRPPARRAGRARAMRPSSRIRIVVGALAPCASRWAMMMPVRPRSSRSTARSISRSVAGSSRDDASSRITRPGSLQEDAGEGQQLRLARRQPAAARRQLACRARAAARDATSPRPRSSSARQDARVGDARVEEGQVVAHAGVEQLHVLRDHADAPAQIGAAAPSRRSHAAQADGARRRVVEAQQAGG